MSKLKGPTLRSAHRSKTPLTSLLLLNAAKASSLLKSVWASAGETDWLLECWNMVSVDDCCMADLDSLDLAQIQKKV